MNDQNTLVQMLGLSFYQLIQTARASSLAVAEAKTPQASVSHLKIPKIARFVKL